MLFSNLATSAINELPIKDIKIEKNGHGNRAQVWSADNSYFFIIKQLNIVKDSNNGPYFPFTSTLISHLKSISLHLIFLISDKSFQLWRLASTFPKFKFHAHAKRRLLPGTFLHIRANFSLRRKEALVDDFLNWRHILFVYLIIIL